MLLSPTFQRQKDLISVSSFQIMISVTITEIKVSLSWIALYLVV